MKRAIAPLIRAALSGVLVLLFLLALLVFVAPFLGPYQPQLVGCQLGLNNMGVTDLSAGDLIRNREVAPSYGFGAPACFGAACTSTVPSPTPPW